MQCGDGYTPSVATALIVGVPHGPPFRDTSVVAWNWQTYCCDPTLVPYATVANAVVPEVVGVATKAEESDP